MPDDYSADRFTTGTVAVGGSATGVIETPRDRDWFAVELVAGRTYVIDLRGSPTGDGTLSDPYLRGIHDADGNRISNTTDDDGGQSYNSRVTFTATESGTHYIAAGAYSSRQGTYELEVTDTSPPETPPEQVQQQPPAFGSQFYAFDLAEDTDGSADRISLGTVSATDPDGGSVTYSIEGGNAAGLFEIDAASGELFYTGGRVAVGDTATGRIGSNGDRDWFAVELVAGRTYVIDLRGSPTDDGTLRDPLLHGIYDADGNRISGTLNDDGGQGYNSRVSFTATESGTHYIAAGAYSGQGTYEVEVTDTSPPIEGQDPDSEDPPDSQEQVQQQPPAFGSQFYAFDLAEDTDGSANRISLGTVSATDPDGGSVTYSIEGGNAAGLFEIDAASGELFYTGGGEDYETGSTSFELTVRASDGDQTTDTAVSVNVTDVDEPVEDNPPVLQPDQSTPQTVSEPAGEDFARNSSTSGRVAVGETATGRIGSSGDRDWFAVELVAGRTYVIDLRGSPTDDGTLRDPFLRGIYDADGNRISNTADDDGGQGYNSRATFTATESGTHYIAAGAYSSRQGTYELEVTDTSPPIVGPDPDSEGPPDRQEQVEQQAPAFGSQFYAFELEENADGGADRISLGTVSATDPDGGSVTYSIEAGNAAGFFEIDAASGELFYTGWGEDYETGFTRFELTVRASDGDQTADTTVTVNVTDVLELPTTEPQGGASPVSESSNQDLPADTSTTGVVVPTNDRDSPRATGNIQTPGDVDWFEMTLQADHNYWIWVSGADQGDNSPTVVGVYDATGTQITDRASSPTSSYGFSPATDGIHYVAIARVPSTSPNSTGQSAQTGPYSVRVLEYPDLPEDSTTSEYTYVGGGGFEFFETPGDRDWIRITSLEAGASYIIDVMASDRPGLIGAEAPDVKLFSVRDSTGAVIPNTEDDDGGVGQNARLKFTAPSTGTYYLDVGTSDDSTGVYDYRVVEDDYAADEATSGRVAVGGTATGTIGHWSEHDWFAVELVAGRTYTIDLRGSSTDDGTLSDPYLRGVYDVDGDRIARTMNADGGEGDNSRVTFRATESGTHYIVAASTGLQSGTYELEVTDSSRTPPAFEQQSYAFDLGEDTDGSTDRISLGAVSATDPDGGSVTYRIEGGNAAGLFEIDAASGELFYTGGGEDYETGSTSFELTIRASDGDQTTDTTVIVNVTDVDEPVEDNPPVVQPDQSTPQTVSEPAGEDFARNSSTSGRVAVGDKATGSIGSSGDRDWFAVELVAGRTYVIDLRGSPTDDGTLRDPFLRGIYDADGNRISGTLNDDGGLFQPPGHLRAGGDGHLAGGIADHRWSRPGLGAGEPGSAR